MPNTTSTTSPRRRAAAAKAAPKSTPATPKAAATPPTTEDGLTRVTLELIKGDDTKSFATFQPPKDSGCVGKFYAPLGTETVKVLLIGPADVVE